MNKYFTPVTLAGLAILSLIISVAIVRPWAGSEAAEIARLSDDPVTASFERAFRHDNAPRHVIRGESIEQDVLYQTLNEINWSRDGLAKRAQDSALNGKNDKREQIEN